MNKHDFLSMAALGPVLLDGATGTNLQKAGMPSGVCPEAWVLDNKDKLQSLQLAFYNAGSNIVYAFSFGANRIKLARHGLPSDSKSVEDINKRLAQISCTVRDQMRQANPGKTYLVAGDLSPTGLFLKPAGDLEFDELVDIYREQVRGLAAAGVDLFVAETMLDLAQTRAAVIAVRTESDLPVMTSLTVEKNGKTLSGDSIRSSLLALAALDVQAFGLNCSFGPEHMIDFFKELPQIDSCTLLVKPNAGIPYLDADGQTHFDMQPADFANTMVKLLPLGVKMVGGCCGTTPAHISSLQSAVSEYSSISEPEADNLKLAGKMPATGQLLRKAEETYALIGSARADISLANWRDFPVIDCESLDDLIDELLDASDDEPAGICVNLDNLNSPDNHIIAGTLAEIQMNISVPLIFICGNSQIQHMVARYYTGLTAFVSDQDIACGNAYYLKR